MDDLAIVQSKATIEELDETLAEQLRSGDTSNTHLAMPDPLDWADIDAFRIAPTRSREYGDLDLDEYLAQLGDASGDITAERLRNRAVSVRFARSTDWDRRWTLYQCLVSEQRADDRLYVLIEGRWFEVSPTLAERVDNFTSRLGHAPLALPSSTRGEAEADYNRRLALAAGGDRLCLDGEILRPEGATSGLEFCDVLTSDGTLLHVKRKSRSSTLSHLFAQGVVSATTLLGDAEFRVRLREVIAAMTGGAAHRWSDLIPGADQQPARDNFRVSYVVIANSRKPGNDWLPFFSKLNLMQSARALQNLGIDVTLDRVEAR